jgi:ATP-dependent RNA helicase DeaD
VVARSYKSAALGRVLDVESPTAALVFCRTRNEVDELVETLGGHGYRAEALHGGMSQEQRERVMKRFRGGTTELLVATDVAARGLDITQLSHDVNYDVPSAPEAYVHRIGRTGRAGREGVAITLAEPREQRLLRNIEALTGQKIEIATVPTVADLRTRRMEQLRASLLEGVLAGGLDAFREVVQSLVGEHAAIDLAAAALRLAQVAAGESVLESEPEIPSVKPAEWPPRREMAARPSKPAPGERAPRREMETRPSKPAQEARAPRPGSAARPSKPPTGERVQWVPRDEAQGKAEHHGGHKAGHQAGHKAGKKKAPWPTTRLYIGAGREAGIKPSDLVGAITNETGVESRALGAIQVGDRYSLVEVPEEIADVLVNALRHTRLKGKKVVIRRDASRTK